ncbi:hypothetical protein GCM10009664_42370 [Kitasatospora gansuensis]
MLGRLLLAVLLGGAWLTVELRTAEPLVDVRALADRRVAPFFLCAVVFGVVYFGSQSPDATFLAADPGVTVWLLCAVLAFGAAAVTAVARRAGRD